VRCIAPGCSAAASDGRGCIKHGAIYTAVRESLLFKPAAQKKKTAPVIRTVAPKPKRKAPEDADLLIARFVHARGRASLSELADHIGTSRSTAARWNAKARAAGYTISRGTLGIGPGEVIPPAAP
jgi:hypothetical protein